MACENRKPEETRGKTGRAAARDLVAAALAGGATQQDAATQGQVNARTVRHWLADPVFRARVSDLRGQMIAEASGRLSAGMSQAADVLRALLANKRPDVRFRAAARLIELATKTAELVDHEERLAALEARAGASPAGPRGMFGGRGG